MIAYYHDRQVDCAQYIDVLRRSTLGERRPIDTPATIAAMVEHADILASAWDGEVLVGVARTLTDYVYIGYLADLAVDASYQRHGIGRALIELTRSRMGASSRLLLLAAPEATTYYPHIGFRAQPQAWVISHHEPLQ